MTPVFSIIIPCRNEGQHLRQTLLSLERAMIHGQEIIVVDDGSEDGCCDFLRTGGMSGMHLVEGKNLGVAGARNAGATQARGDILCFCDAHVQVPPGWLEKLVRPILGGQAEIVCPAVADSRRPQVAGYGATWGRNLQWQWLCHPPSGPSFVPLAPGCCLAVSRRVYEELEGFERGFGGFGFEDQEFSLKAWLFGYRVMVHPDVRVLHLFREAHPYAVRADEVLHNFLCMAVLHFNRRRLQWVVEMSRRHPAFPRIMTRILTSDAWDKRERYLQRRRYDDDWFMEKFGIPF